MAKIQIGIGLGHGGAQPGAVGTLGGKTYLEKSLVRKMSPFLLGFLNGDGRFEAKTLNELCGKENDATWPPLRQRKDVEAMLKARDLSAIIIFHFDSSAKPSPCGWSFCYNSNRPGDRQFAQNYYEGARDSGNGLAMKIDVDGNRAERIKPRTDLALLKTEDIVQNLRLKGLGGKGAEDVALSIRQALDLHLRANPPWPLADTVRATLSKRNLAAHSAEALPVAEKIERTMMLAFAGGKPEMNLLLVECGFLSNIGDLAVAVGRPSDIAFVNFAAVSRCFP